MVDIIIDNAIRFNDKSAIRIRITGNIVPGFLELNFRDNGPGIDSRFHEKVFVIFQTLNARDAVEATGAGLAIAKKIIESWNGSIKIINHEGEGAHFMIRIPANNFAATPVTDTMTANSFEN